MGGLPDPDWYFENVLYHASPGGGRVDAGPAARWQAWWRSRAASADGPAEVRAASSGFVLTTHQLDQLGYTRGQVRARLRRGDWWSPRRGVVATVRRPDDADDPWRAVAVRHALSATAAVTDLDDASISGRSAAVLHGLPTFAGPDRAQLTVHAPTRLGRRSAVHPRGAALHAEEVEAWFGAPVTGVARTLVDLGRHDRRDAVIAADAAMREKLVSRSDIELGLFRAGGWPGIRQARDVLRLADPRAESPLESLVRLALHDDGFPAPELQVDIGGFEVDFCWPRRRLILEADGRIKYTNDALWREKRRETVLRRLGWRVERVIWDDVVRNWPATRDALWAAVVG